MVARPPRPADADDAKRQQRRRLAWRLAGAGLAALGVLVLLLLACVLWIPKWLYPSLTDTDLQNVSDAAKVQELKGARLKLQNDARTTLLQGLGALLVLSGAGIGASVTLRQVRATRDQITQTATASRNQLKLSEQGQITDRYTKAIDQLDDKKALAVRLGGLYALERIARDWPDDRATIAEVLCAYARTAPRPKPATPRAKNANPAGRRRYPGRKAVRRAGAPDGTRPGHTSRGDHPRPLAGATSPGPEQCRSAGRIPRRRAAAARVPRRRAAAGRNPRRRAAAGREPHPRAAAGREP